MLDLRYCRMEQKITAELDWFEDQLAGREHLVGDKFGRADLTAASSLPLWLTLRVPAVPKVHTPGAIGAGSDAVEGETKPTMGGKDLR